MMWRQVLMTACTLGAAGCLLGSLSASEPQIVPHALFDGQTFDGWEGDLAIFQIRDAAIVGGSLDAPVARNEFLCTTREYADFQLRLEFKLLGEGANAGVQFRTHRIPEHHEVSGYQADMGENYWGCLYDESRRNCVLAQADPELLQRVVRFGDWNSYVIRAEGPRIRLWLNGAQTIDYTEEDPAIDRSGVIALQIHGGGPSEAWYRHIELLELPPAE